MQTPVLLGLTGLLLTGFTVNEVTHGGMAEGFGLGHRHLTDYGGYHCAQTGDGEMWTKHQEHMHNGTDAGEHCGNDHMGGSGHMRGGGRMGGGMMMSRDGGD